MAFPFSTKKTTPSLGSPATTTPLLPGADELDDDSAGKMSFLDHLDELRRRLVASAISLGVGAAVAFVFIDRIFAFIMKPLADKLPAGARLTAVEPTEPFMLYIKIGLLAGVVIAAPLITWQLWLFISPGLYSHEKRFALPFVLMASVFFVAGAAFNH
ncbi:preprotein translocase subunit TatC, partial [bacterium]|nr:preprotein translocase subunit TatC [bacterium]